MSSQESIDSARKLTKTYGSTILIAVTAALCIRYFVIEAYRIPSNSMHPALEAGDTIFVAKWPFGIRVPFTPNHLTAGRKPRYGEVVVFLQPGDPPRDAIRRVVGLSGDTVQIKSGKILLNGSEITHQKDPNSICGEESPPNTSYPICWEPPMVEDFGPEKIPDGSVFLIGDLRSDGVNRKQKIWNTVPLTSLKGVALWVWLSIDPRAQGAPSKLFSRIRFERMFRRI